MIGRDIVQVTCKLCDTPVSVITAIHRGLCRSHAQQERIARRARLDAGMPTLEDVLISTMNESRKVYVKMRPCATCGVMVRKNRSDVARCKPCFLRERFGERKTRDMVAVSMRLPVSIVNALRLQAHTDNVTFTAVVERTLAKLTG